MQLLEAHRAQESAQVRRPELRVALEPTNVLHQMVEEHRIALGDRIVAEPAVLVLEVGPHVREVEGVPELVQEGVPVGLATVRPNHEVYLVRYPNGRAESERTIPLPVACIED